MSTPRDVISTILKHDAKVTSYKLALLRSINDVVLSFPDLARGGRDVAVPLRSLAEFWVACLWPFCDPAGAITQGQLAQRKTGPRLGHEVPSPPRRAAAAVGADHRHSRPPRLRLLPSPRPPNGTALHQTSG